jgi:hypothetical protein
LDNTIDELKLENNDWIAVYKPGLLALVKERAQLQKKVIDLETEIERFRAIVKMQS